LIAILFLYLEMGIYEFKIKGGPSPMVMTDQGSGVGDQRPEAMVPGAIVGLRQSTCGRVIIAQLSVSRSSFLVPTSFLSLTPDPCPLSPV
jgi:hypothetical protein